MGTKAIKVSEENYKWLCKLSGELQKEAGEPVSINGALDYLHKKKLSDLAGAWEMTDKEIKNIKEDLKRGWSRWKAKSV